MTYVEHLAHGEWSEIGRCTYCKCGERMWNGPIGDREATARALDALVAAVQKKRAAAGGDDG